MHWAVGRIVPSVKHWILIFGCGRSYDLPKRCSQIEYRGLARYDNLSASHCSVIGPTTSKKSMQYLYLSSYFSLFFLHETYLCIVHVKPYIHVPSISGIWNIHSHINILFSTFLQLNIECQELRRKKPCNEGVDII